MNVPALTLLAAALIYGVPVMAATGDSLVGLTRDTAGADLPPAERERLRRFAEQITAKAQESAASGMVKYKDIADRATRRADSIASAALAEDRDAALRLIGIDPNGGSTMFYFVSWSMPQEMLRTYALEAMWTGGTLVFKGVPPGRDFKDFIVNDLQSLVYGKGAYAAISLDPRMYDSYGITSVPTIVLTEDRSNPLCGADRKQFKYGKKTLSYTTCPAIAEDKYWKMTGTVTSDYALREFKAAGSVSAETHLASLAKGLAVGVHAGQTAKPYTGAWKDAVTPAELEAGRKAISDLQNSRGSATSTPLRKQ